MGSCSDRQSLDGEGGASGGDGEVGAAGADRTAQAASQRWAPHGDGHRLLPERVASLSCRPRSCLGEGTPSAEVALTASDKASPQFQPAYPTREFILPSAGAQRKAVSGFAGAARHKGPSFLSRAPSAPNGQRMTGWRPVHRGRLLPSPPWDEEDR